jgi:short-subunit dehydrogenase
MEPDLKGKTVLITGASSGMGQDYAREFAARGLSLVLVARRAEALQLLAQELRARFHAAVEVKPCDLSDATAREQLYADLRNKSIRVDLLVNNAGFGLFGSFDQLKWPEVRQLIDVDITGVTHLTHLFLPQMMDQRWGRILFVASTAAFQPTPGYAVYAAAKSYILSFGPAINHELHGTGVSCTTVCPGVTETPFFDIAGQKKTFYHRFTEMKSDVVAHEAVQALLAGRETYVPGWANSALALSTRFAPRSLLAGIAERLMGYERPSAHH